MFYRLVVARSLKGIWLIVRRIYGVFARVLYFLLWRNLKRPFAAKLMRVFRSSLANTHILSVRFIRGVQYRSQAASEIFWANKKAGCEFHEERLTVVVVREGFAGGAIKKIKSSQNRFWPICISNSRQKGHVAAGAFLRHWLFARLFYIPWAPILAGRTRGIDPSNWCLFSQQTSPEQK